MKKVLFVLALLAGSFLSAIEIKEETVASWPNLHQAIWNGDTNKALKLCKKHPEQMTELAAFEFEYPGIFSYLNDDFKVDDFKYSALELAILQENTEIAKKLIESHAQVERKREEITKMVKLISNTKVKTHHAKITPLGLAVRTKQYDIVKELIKVLKSINEIKVDYYYEGYIVWKEFGADDWHSSDKITKVSHLFSEPDQDLVAAALTGLSDLEEDLAQEIAVLIVKYEGEKVHAIENALAENDFEAFELLITYYPKALYKDESNKTSLLTSITSSPPEYFEAFLSSPFLDLYSPAKILEVASGTGHLEAMQWALDQGSSHFGPAYTAAIRGNQQEALELLIGLSEPTYAQIKTAIEKNQIDCLKLLLPYFKETTQNLETILHDMIEKGRHEILTFFLQEYSLPDIYSYTVFTPYWWPVKVNQYDAPMNSLEYACRCNKLGCVKALINYQQPTEAQIRSALKFAMNFGSIEMVEYLCGQLGQGSGGI